AGRLNGLLESTTAYLAIRTADTRPMRFSSRSHIYAAAARSRPGRPDLDGVDGALGGGADERPDAEVLHVPLGEPAVELAELRRGVLSAVHAGDEGPAGVVVLPLGEVVDLAADDDPAVVERRVLRELLARDGPVAGPRLRRLPEAAGDLL